MNWSVPATAPPGSYVVKMALFTPGWASFLQYLEPAVFTVTSTCSNTSFQSLIDAAPAGSVLSVPACVYRETITVNKSLSLDGHGQATIKGSDVWGDWSPTGRLYQSASTVPAFSTHGECATSDNRCLHAEQVFLDSKRLTLVLSGNPSTGQFALDNARHVLLADNPAGHTVEVTTRPVWALSNGGHSNWTVQNNQLALAHGWVLALSGGSNLKALDNDISFGGQLGLGSAQTTGVLIQNNKIHDNNTDGFDAFWEAGGLKMALQTEPVVDGNEFNDNNGPGLWADINCQRVTFSNNTIHNNQKMGILLWLMANSETFLSHCICNCIAVNPDFFDNSDIPKRPTSSPPT